MAAVSENKLTIEVIENSCDLNLATIYHEYPPECIPKKLKTPTGDKAKRAKFEQLDTKLYEAKANMVACRINGDRILLWIKALHVFYFDYLGKKDKYNIEWFDDPSDWQQNSESGQDRGNKAICIDVSKVENSDVQRQYRITLFINTGVLQAQGTHKDVFAEYDFNILKVLIDKVQDRLKTDQMNNPTNLTTHTTTEEKKDQTIENQKGPSTSETEKCDTDQTFQKQCFTESQKITNQEIVHTKNQSNEWSMAQFRPEKMMGRMENCFLLALDKICVKQTELFDAKLTKILENVVKIQKEGTGIKDEDRKLTNKVSSLEHENSDLKLTLQKARHELEMDKIHLQTKLDQQTHQASVQKQTFTQSLKKLETEIESMGEAIQKKDEKLDCLERSYNDLKTKLDEKDGEIYSLKQHESRDESAGRFQEVQSRHRGAAQNKPHVALIGTSNMDRVDISKLSSKFTVEKHIAYKFSDTKQSITKINHAPDLIVFHSLTNELRETSAENCVKQMMEIISVANEAYPTSKFIISAPTPRADCEKINAKGQLVGALLKQEYIESDKVFLCDHSNLANKGRAIMRFINSEDKFHLSDQGANVFAANIRDVIDEALNLPKRHQYNNNRRGTFRGRYNNRYRGRGRGYWQHNNNFN